LSSAINARTHDGAGGEEVREAVEEGLAREVGVVGLRHRLGGLLELHGHQLVALLLEAGDDLADEAALDRVGLQRHEGALPGDGRGLGRGVARDGHHGGGHVRGSGGHGGGGGDARRDAHGGLHER